MPVRQQQDNISISDFLFAFSRLMRWAIDNPLQAMVAMLAFQAVLTTARRESPQAKDIGLEMDEILEPLAANAIDLETRDLTQSFVVQDVSAYSQRNLQQGQSCQLAYNYADGFALSFGGSNSDQAQTVAVLSDGSIVVAGSSNSFAGNNNFDGFIVKFFTNGTMIWAKSFGAVSTDDNIRAMIVKPDGKILVAGDTSSYGAGYSDILLAQFSTEGGLEWVKAYGKSEAEYAYSLAYSPLDKVLVTGYTSSFGAGGNGDILVAQFSANGAFEWAKAFGTTSAEFGKAIAVRSDGKMLVSGDANNQVFVMQLSSAGALEWSQSFGSTSEETHRAMTVGSDNKVQVLSQTNGYVSGGGALLLQLTSAGALDWAKVLSKAGGGSMGALYLRSNGSIVLSGAVNTGSNCLNMAQFSTSGAYEWGKILTAKSGTSTESAAIAVSPEGRLIVAGRESGIVDSTGNMLLLSLNSNNGLFALGSNGAW
ncbi:MAG: kinase domain protein, partial [Gammaproteobacteria bacterium]|nr:kinase domain protein [Gammaproteobacteria bacterium]